MTMMAVGNARQAGGGALLTPHALIDDGAFDVMVVPAHDHDQAGHLLADLLRLRHGESARFRYLLTPSLRIESEDELQFNLDGEPVRGRIFDFSLLPGALELVLPQECPLLGERGPRSDSVVATTGRAG